MFLCVLVCHIGYSVALMTVPYDNIRWESFSATKTKRFCGQFNVQQHHISRVGRSFYSCINKLNSNTKLPSKAILEDGFDSDLNDDDLSTADAKGGVDDDDEDIGADEYFGRFISEALKGEISERTLSSDSKQPNDANILAETKRMIEQQQQQIDLLMKLVNNQGRQQMPPRPVSSTNLYEKDDDDLRASPLFSSTSSTRQKPNIVPPLKAMLFIDGTWLYYSLNTRNPKHDAIVSKFGKGWQNNYRVDW